jgi:hypothetical protein
MMTEQYPSGDVEIGFHELFYKRRPFALGYPSGDVEIGFRIVLQEETHCVRLSKWGC